MSDLEVAPVAAPVVRDVLPFPDFQSTTMSISSVDNNTIIEIHKGFPNLDFTTKDNIRFRIDYINIPFHIIIRLLLGLSIQINFSLMYYILIQCQALGDDWCSAPKINKDMWFLIHVFRSFDMNDFKILRNMDARRGLGEQLKGLVTSIKSKTLTEAMQEFNKSYFVPQYVGILHSFQNSVDNDWVIELVFPPSVEGVVSVRKELKDFFDLHSQDTKGLQKVNETHMARILKLLASCLHVKHGFTGDNRETPIPSASAAASFLTGSKHINSMVSDSHNMLAKSIFRHIGVSLSTDNLIFLLTMMCYSSNVTLNPNVKEVISELFTRKGFENDIGTVFEKATSVSMWKVMNLLPNELIAHFFRFNSDASSLYYHFSQWFSNSSLKSSLSIADCASAFQLGGVFTVEVVAKHKAKSFAASSLKSPANRTFNDWVNIVTYNGAEVIMGQFKFDVASSPVLTKLQSENNTDLITQLEESFEQFKDFLNKKGFQLDSCILCEESHLSNNKKFWRSMGCNNGCDAQVHICNDCFNRNYNSTPEPGHVLEIAKVSCVQCRSLLPNVDIRFPTGTPLETLVELSNQFYSCCSVGCRNFIHVPPEEGVVCANRPDHVNDIFCEQHVNVISNELQTMMKPCPGCNQMIFKVEGCNHMTCTGCGTEFCMRPNCSYYVSSGNTFTHPSYCRSGISDEVTVSSLNHIISTIVTDAMNNHIISIETETMISSVLTNIVFMGLDFELYNKLYEILDYINLYKDRQLNNLLLVTLLRDMAGLIARFYPGVQIQAVPMVMIFGRDSI
jgi:hypothetical protein